MRVYSFLCMAPIQLNAIHLYSLHLSSQRWIDSMVAIVRKSDQETRKRYRQNPHRATRLQYAIRPSLINSLFIDIFLAENLPSLPPKKKPTKLRLPSKFRNFDTLPYFFSSPKNFMIQISFFFFPGRPKPTLPLTRDKELAMVLFTLKTPPLHHNCLKDVPGGMSDF